AAAPAPAPAERDRAATEPGPPPVMVDADPTLDDELLPVEVVAPTEGAALPGLHPSLLEDDLAIPEGPIDDEAGRERRTYVRTIADASSADAEGATLGRI